MVDGLTEEGRILTERSRVACLTVTISEAFDVGDRAAAGSRDRRDRKLFRNRRARPPGVGILASALLQKKDFLNYVLTTLPVVPRDVFDSGQPW